MKQKRLVLLALCVICLYLLSGCESNQKKTVVETTVAETTEMVLQDPLTDEEKAKLKDVELSFFFDIEKESYNTQLKNYRKAIEDMDLIRRLLKEEYDLTDFKIIRCRPDTLDGIEIYFTILVGSEEKRASGTIYTDRDNELQMSDGPEEFIKLISEAGVDGAEVPPDEVDQYDVESAIKMVTKDYIRSVTVNDFDLMEGYTLQDVVDGQVEIDIDATIRVEYTDYYSEYDQEKLEEILHDRLLLCNLNGHYTVELYESMINLLKESFSFTVNN